MKLECSELKNGVRLIELNGRLDLNGTYSVEIEFVRNCDGDRVRVFVDLSEVSYISSVGIPMLVNTAKSVMGRGGKFVLIGPQEDVRKTLEMVGVAHFIPIYPDLDSAMAELAAKP